MVGAASRGENKYFYLVSLLEIGLIKYDFSSAVSDFWVKKINFQEGYKMGEFIFAPGGAGPKVG